MNMQTDKTSVAPPATVADIKRILGKERSQDDRDTQLKSLLVSAGFTF